MTGVLDIFIEVNKEKFETETIEQLAADVTPIAAKISYDFC